MHFYTRMCLYVIFLDVLKKERWRNQLRPEWENKNNFWNLPKKQIMNNLRVWVL